jgi:hypothetical protein
MLERVGLLPDGLEPVEPGRHRTMPAYVLAFGERTGHASWPPADPQLRFFRPTDRHGLTLGFAALDRPSELRHDEHRPICHKPGLWRA